MNLRFFIIVGIALSLVQFVSAFNSTDDLAVGLTAFPFEINASSVSGGYIDGVCTGGGCNHTNEGCKNGYCYNFTGASTGDHFNLAPTSAMPTGTQNRTISYWMNLWTPNPCWSVWCGIYEYGADADYRIFGNFIQAGQFAFHGWGGGDLYSGKYISTNQWYMITNVFDGSTNTLSIYINGSFVISASKSLNTDVGFFWIGGWADDLSRRAKMLMDEYYVWNRTLNSTEINSLWANGSGIFYEWEPQSASILSVDISPASPYDNETLNCAATTDLQTNISITWWHNDSTTGGFIRNNSFDVTAYYTTTITTSLSNGSYPAPHEPGAVYICQASIDGDVMNSSTVTTSQAPCVVPEYTVYQETQTNYTDLTGGWVSLGNIFDGSQATAGYGDIPDGFAQVQIEYAKPVSNYLYGAYWYVHNAGGDYGTAEYNGSLPSDCWNAYPDRLILSGRSKKGTANDREWYCYNGTAWVGYSGAYGGSPQLMYEESINWKYHITPNIAITYSLPQLNVSPIPTFSLNTSMYYSNATSSECMVNDNANWVSCTNVTHNYCTTTKASTCTITGHHEGYVVFNATCPQGVSSPNYNIYIDADSNPAMTTNASSVYTTTPLLPFYFQINATNWVESPTCSIENMTPVVQCGVGTMVAQGGGTYLGLATCVGQNFTQVGSTFYIQCNGTSLYQLINSTPTLLVYDPTGPTITYSQFTGNGSWFAKNITGRWDFWDLNLYRINVSIDGSPIFQQTGINATNYTYILNHYVGDLIPGLHEFEIWMYDAHTKKELKDDWSYSTPFLSDKMVFTPKRNGKQQARIEVVAMDKDTLTNPWEVQQKADRHTFTFNTNTDRQVYHFKVTSDVPIEVVKRANTVWKEWAVIGDYWIDFYTEDPSVKTTVKQIDTYTVQFDVEGVKKEKGAAKKQLYQSIGELNSVHLHYYFNTYNVTLTYYPSIPEATEQNASMAINYGTNPPTSHNVTFTYNGSVISYSTYNESGKILFNSTAFYSPVVTQTREEVGTWTIQMPYETNNATFNQTVVRIGLSKNDCGNSSYMKVLTFYGRDEDTNENVTFDMNIHFSLWTTSELLMSDIHLELRNESSYDICLYPNSTVFHMRAILEYEALGYTGRKYYLYNTSLSSTKQDVYLYLLPTAESTTVTVEVLDAQTTDPIEGAYVRVLRYFPGREGSATYSQVEVAKTDNNGKSIIRARTLDTFYKFIIEYPEAEIKLETEVQKVLTETKTFLINLGLTSGLEVWSRVQEMTTRVDCDESTQTCSYTWANQGLTAQAATLRIYELSGTDKVLIYNQTVTASAGTIAYIVPGYKNNTRYVAEAEISGYDGVLYPAGSDDMITIDTLFGQINFRKAALFPYLLIMLVLVFAFIDVGAVGVATAGLISLIAGWMFGIMAFNTGLAAGLIICIMVIIFKLSRS